MNKHEAKRAAEVRRIIAILHKWGIHTLGQFAALEKEDVSLRLGPEAARMWERASGKAMRLLKLVEPPETFAETFEFEQDIETIEPLLFILRRFLQGLTLRLSALYLVAKELQLEISFSDKQSYAHQFKIPEPSNNEEVLFRMLHTHLEDFKSAAPIIAVSLAAEATKPTQQQGSLFETALRDPTQLSETLARLIGLLGAERVGTPVLEDTHQPDAFRMEPFAWRLEEAPPELPPLPAFTLRRFRSPAPATVSLKQKQPTDLRSAELHGAVLEQAGPFMASGHWWDEQTWSRAEWDLQLENGAVCRCHAHEQGWAVDGIYD
ncbi:MAG: hypothetical protein ABI946_07170 [Chthoniobacterales bacterium]